MRLEGLENINNALSVHYLIYKITNNINHKYYIGLHITDNVYDNYKGSGYLLPAAYAKYGLSSFTKTILFDFNNFDEMNDKEKELVPLSKCYPYDLMSYNLVSGGHSGQLPEITLQKRIKKCIETWKNKSNTEKKRYSELKRKQTLGKNNPMYKKNVRDFMSNDAIAKMDEKRKNTWKSKTKEELQIKEQKRKQALANRTEEEKQRTHELLSAHSAGKNNPMYGTTFVWMVNDILHKRIRADKSKVNDYIKHGFTVGYKFTR